jgi:hypothetical protein
MLVRVFANPDGSIQMAAPSLKAGESDQQALDRYLARLSQTQPEVAALPHIDIDSSTLPPRAQRHAWRISGSEVIADPSVPPPAPAAPDPRRLRQRIEAATDFGSLKSALLEAFPEAPA